MEVIQNEIGSYTISEKAFQDIAAICVSGINNVYPAKKDKDFVTCKFGKNGDLTIDLFIRVKQGVDIVKLCKKIQDEINENILLMTGVECKKINIDIQGFETKK